jgi:hypothetical protein
MAAKHPKNKEDALGVKNERLSAGSFNIIKGGDNALWKLPTSLL